MGFFGKRTGRKLSGLAGNVGKNISSPNSGLLKAASGEDKVLGALEKGGIDQNTWNKYAGGADFKIPEITALPGPLQAEEAKGIKAEEVPSVSAEDYEKSFGADFKIPEITALPGPLQAEEAPIVSAEDYEKSFEDDNNVLDIYGDLGGKTVSKAELQAAQNPALPGPPQAEKVENPIRSDFLDLYGDFEGKPKETFKGSMFEETPEIGDNPYEIKAEETPIVSAKDYEKSFEDDKDILDIYGDLGGKTVTKEELEKELIEQNPNYANQAAANKIGEYLTDEEQKDMNFKEIQDIIDDMPGFIEDQETLKSQEELGSNPANIQAAFDENAQIAALTPGEDTALEDDIEMRAYAYGQDTDKKKYLEEIAKQKKEAAKIDADYKKEQRRMNKINKYMGLAGAAGAALSAFAF